MKLLSGNTHIDFFSERKYAFVFSAILIVLSIGVTGLEVNAGP